MFFDGPSVTRPSHRELWSLVLAVGTFSYKYIYCFTLFFSIFCQMNSGLQESPMRLVHDGSGVGAISTKKKSRKNPELVYYPPALVTPLLKKRLFDEEGSLQVDINMWRCVSGILTTSPCVSEIRVCSIGLFSQVRFLPASSVLSCLFSVTNQVEVVIAFGRSIWEGQESQKTQYRPHTPKSALKPTFRLHEKKSTRTLARVRASLTYQAHRNRDFTLAF